MSATEAQVHQQIEIETKFVEITQNNLKELGFDWLLGQANIHGSKLVFPGGTAGNASGVKPRDFSFSNSAGVFTDQQFQHFLRANQKKGVDLLSAPKLTLKSGEKGVIDIIREFHYPSEFGAASSHFEAAPARYTPQEGTAVEWDIEGVNLDVTPLIEPNGTIELDLRPRKVGLDVFPSRQGAGRSTPASTMHQSHFSSGKTTSLNLQSGQTIMLGALAEEKTVNMINGRKELGRTINKAMVIFVTAKIINFPPTNEIEQMEAANRYEEEGWHAPPVHTDLFRTGEVPSFRLGEVQFNLYGLGGTGQGENIVTETQKSTKTISQINSVRETHQEHVIPDDPLSPLKDVTTTRNETTKREVTTKHKTQKNVAPIQGGFASAGAEAKVFVTRNIGLGVEGDWIDGETSIGIAMGTVTARFPIGTNAPYVSGGAGVQYGDRTRAVGMLGVGFEHRFNPAVAAFIAAHGLFSELENAAIFRGGFSFIY